MRHAPRTTADVSTVVSQTAAESGTLDICGGDSKRAMYERSAASAVLDMSGVSGVIDYDPDELVLKVHAGTPLAEVEAELVQRRQMLAFEPFDHGPLFGEQSGRATLGGIIAANVSGPRRISAGAARDHILGFEAVSGRGQILKGGGAVVKNVSGFDLPKLVAGSLGTLVVLTSVTLRVLPKPATESTVLFRGLSDEIANRLMGRALSEAAALSGVVHLPGETATTALRIEGFGPSVVARCREIGASLESIARSELLDAGASQAFWQRVRRLDFLPVKDFDLWRVSVPPSAGWKVGAVVQDTGSQTLYDWAGGLVWLAVPEAAPTSAAERIVAMARASGGHAQLIRATPSLRRFTDALRSSPPGLRELQRRVKAAFDPAGVLNPGLDPAANF